MHYRSIWLSDFHLGSRHCKAEYLLHFLASHESKYLYLVGDIFDGWALRRSWYWGDVYNDVLQSILAKARSGTKVTYIPGNHDEFARDFLNIQMGGIAVRSHLVHLTADGRRFLVLHGDEFDGFIRYTRWLTVLGAWAYQVALGLNHWYNGWRRQFGKPYWSLSAYLKHKAKRATQFIAQWEEAVAMQARKHAVDGVICGHIHHAELRRIGPIEYANTGDWVESCTALVEGHEGKLEIIRYVDIDHDSVEALARKSVRPTAADGPGGDGHATHPALFLGGDVQATPGSINPGSSKDDLREVGESA